MTAERATAHRSCRHRATARLGALALVAAVMAMGACGSDEASPASLPDGTYRLESISGRDLVEGTTIELLVEADTVNLGAGCNRMFGDYAIEDGRLVVGQLASTRMACSPESMDQDEWLIALMTSEPTVEIDGDRLTISDDEVSLGFALPAG